MDLPLWITFPFPDFFIALFKQELCGYWVALKVVQVVSGQADDPCPELWELTTLSLGSTALCLFMRLSVEAFMRVWNELGLFVV